MREDALAGPVPAAVHLAQLVALGLGRTTDAEGLAVFPCLVRQPRAGGPGQVEQVAGRQGAASVFARAGAQLVSSLSLSKGMRLAGARVQVGALALLKKVNGSITLEVTKQIQERNVNSINHFVDVLQRFLR